MKSMKNCELQGCGKPRTPQTPGAEIGYVVNNLTRRLSVCTDCAMKIVAAPRGSYEITPDKRLRFVTKTVIIT